MRETVVYKIHMLTVRQTDEFATWLAGLKDSSARTRILARIDRLALGNAGDAEPVGEGVSEMRIHYGAGYRVYFVQRGTVLVVILAGGTKKTQGKDIRTAIKLAKTLET